MCGVRRLNLKGRVVGYSVPYFRDPSQVSDGEPLEATRTRWARVVAHFQSECLVQTVVVRSINGDDPLDRAVYTNAIHTVMPERYQHV